MIRRPPRSTPFPTRRSSDLALIVARLGTYIPMPGIDATELARQIQQQQGSLLDVFNLLAGGAIGRMGIFALGIMPYISSSIIIPLMTDRKSTRLNSSHLVISYAGFCLKKKKCDIPPS